MKGNDWLVTEDGKYQAGKPVREWDLLEENQTPPLHLESFACQKKM